MALWIIIYLVTGFGMFWILNKEDEFFAMKLRKFVESKYDSEYDRNEVLSEYVRSTRWIPTEVKPWMLALAIILSLVIWTLWPIVTVVCGIIYWWQYRKLTTK